MKKCSDALKTEAKTVDKKKQLEIERHWNAEQVAKLKEKIGDFADSVRAHLQHACQHMQIHGFLPAVVCFM
jgi:hypothetical protein